MSTETVDEIWPDLGLSDVPAFLDRLKAGVLQLETAFQTGDGLAAQLDDPNLRRDVGPSLIETYSKLLRTAVGDAGAIRSTTIATLLDHATSDLTPRVTSFVDAQGAHQPHRTCTLDGVRTTLRHDQILSSRFWGIGFEHATEEENDEHARRLVSVTIQRLSSDILGLQHILERFQRGRGRPDVQIVPPPEDRRFEHILLDILNEDARRATLAPVMEDFLEKTDFRVKYPDLERRRGARVQATSIISSKRHHEKREAISRTEEYVFLSPLSLAEFAKASPEHAKSLAECLETEISFVEGVAYEIRHILNEAIDKPAVSPLGPLARVPKQLRALVRAYVETMAMDTTARLRNREAEHGRSTPRRHRNHRSRHRVSQSDVG